MKIIDTAIKVFNGLVDFLLDRKNIRNKPQDTTGIKHGVSFAVVSQFRFGYMGFGYYQKTPVLLLSEETPGQSLSKLHALNSGFGTKLFIGSLNDLLSSTVDLALSDFDDAIWSEAYILQELEKQIRKMISKVPDPVSILLMGSLQNCSLYNDLTKSQAKEKLVSLIIKSLIVDQRKVHYVETHGIQETNISQFIDEVLMAYKSTVGHVPLTPSNIPLSK